LLAGGGAAAGSGLAILLGLPPVLLLVLATVGALLGGATGVAVAALTPTAPSGAQQAVDALERGAQVPNTPDLAPLRALQDRVHSSTTVEAELRDELAAAQRRALKAESRVYTAVQSATDATKVRGAFLTRMSHELRTPLNAVIGYAEMVSEELDDPELQQDLTRIRRAGLHLKGLVTTVLDLTQLESGRYEVRPEPVDLGAMVSEIVEGASNEAETLKNTIETRVAPSATAKVDARMTRSILFNLVQNAVKYTGNGTVRITVSVDKEVHLQVQDTGIGMTERQLEHAFDAFFQGDDGTTRRYDGSGLGLAICKGFAEAMGGRIQAQSEVGKGATIDVFLPLDVEPRIPDDEDIDEPTMLLR